MKSYFPLLLLLINLSFVSCSNSEQINTEKDKRDAIVAYLVQPYFRNDDFCKQLTATNAKPEIFDLHEQVIYFSVSENEFNKGDVISKLCAYPDSVKYSTSPNRNKELGKYSVVCDSCKFFSFPVSCLILPKQCNFTADYKNIQYSIADTELINYAQYKSVYGGELYFKKFSSDNAYNANHAAVVTKGIEPSLKRFVNKLIGNETNKEKQIQILLHFVTNEIAYDSIEGYMITTDVLKKANEVLLTKKSDCSGKTILYASLLEQIGAEYRLAYLKGHICVITKGNFKNENKYVFEWDNQNYYLAETTCPDFEIGVSKLAGDPTDILMIQKPDTVSNLYNYRNGLQIE
ncbi:MAG: hypothetical protein Q8M29_19295 [Bacteroidota bacterium]|nr:hypothetical protein [Bacteroidota bacterium]